MVIFVLLFMHATHRRRNGCDRPIECVDQGFVADRNIYSDQRNHNEAVPYAVAVPARFNQILRNSRDIVVTPDTHLNNADVGGGVPLPIT
jgi:hypothetical protein